MFVYLFPKFKFLKLYYPRLKQQQKNPVQNTEYQFMKEFRLGGTPGGTLTQCQTSLHKALCSQGNISELRTKSYCIFLNVC